MAMHSSAPLGASPSSAPLGAASHHRQDRRTPRNRNWTLTVLGWTCLALGMVILAGGLWLIALGGSWYYGLAGLGLSATGLLLNYQRIEAVPLYVAVWLGTVAWAWWEVGADWWAELPRVLAPTLILILVLLCIPALARRR